MSHAYLFCGSRGTGKTTCAKILAKAVNCASPVNGSPCNKCESCRSIDAGTATDVLEMDAASNNGVDNIRDIRDEVVYTPSSLKYRVYIVDEVHMLSGSAFNALLKTLEEPPAHAIFILATTELHKLPSTIVSRCQRHDFRRISTDTLVSRLAYISDKEGIEYDPGALRIIAKMAQGGMRDAISLLELCAGGRERIGAVENVVRSSKDISAFWQDLISFYRDMLVVKTTKEAKNYLDLTDDEMEKLSAVAALFTKETLLYHCRVLDDTLYSMQKAGFAKRTVAEMALVKMCDMSLEVSNDTLLARLSKLESAVAMGSFVRPDSEVQRDVSVEEDEHLPKVKEKPAQVKHEYTVVADESKPELRALRGWSEICDKAAVDNGAALGF